MEKKKLFLDFDNTLVNTNSVCIQMLNERYNTLFTLGQLHRYDFGDLWPNVTSREVCDMFESREMFDRLNFIGNSYEILSRAKEYFDIDIVTCGSVRNGLLKLEFIEDNCPFVDNVYVVDERKHDKSSVDMSGGIFIDDHIESLRSSNASVKIMYKFYSDGDWNQYDNKDEIYVVNTWNEIEEMLNFYAKEGFNF